MNKRILYSLFLLVSLYSCLVINKSSLFDKGDFVFPEMQFPEGNEYSESRFELGKKLFFDPILSIDSTLSCASCHLPNYAFSDTVNFSPGVFGRAGVRNAPSILNIGYHPYLLREGSIPTIEMQVLVPIQEKNEFAHNIVDISEDLKKITAYTDLSEKAYNREIDYYVITRALGVYERTLISKNSKFDNAINGKASLSKEEKKGMNLFFSSKTNCSSCHGGFNFTKYKITNNGLYENYKDLGKMRATKDSADIAKFKTPSLRNVALSAPYMHDGSIKTLEEVLEHYNTGGKNHVNKDALIKPLNLTEEEKKALISFLKNLTEEY
ncbi:c-type cytochrome [Flavobacteriales bacterium]|nr:c-type cytochrome [Flavobacteriales bacterium]